MTIDRTTLMQAYPSWLTSGIFTDLDSYDVPWKADGIADRLDLLYYGHHSGEKIISPMVEKLAGGSGAALEDSARAQIAAAAWQMFGQNWSKLYATLSFTYDPIANVDASIAETTERSGKRDATDGIKHTGTIARALTGTDTTDTTGTNTNATTGTDTTEDTGTVKDEGTSKVERSGNDSAYGFNSSSASPTDSMTGTESTTSGATRTNDATETVTHGRMDTETLGTKESVAHDTTDTETRDTSDDHTAAETSSGTETHNVTRKGNIGVTTTQSMINEEREVWGWYFYEVVFTDLDKILTIQTY